MLVLSSILFATLVAIGATLSLSYSNNNYLKAQNEEQEYTLTLDSTTQFDPSNPNYKGIAYTAAGNPIIFKFWNYSTSEGNFGTLTSGYIQNETLISGLKSINITFSGPATCTLRYWWNTQSEMVMKSLASKETFTFEDLCPTFIYIQNPTSTPMEIESIVIKYSCDGGEIPVEKLKLSYTSISGGTAYSVSASDNLAFAFIPSEYNGKPVTTIADSAFQWKNTLQVVTIPDSVITIGSNAFEYCSALTSVNIPDSVTSLGSNCFSNCTSITSATLSSNITSLPTQAFFHCEKLTSITIPDGVISIGEYAFEHCDELTSISLPGTLQSISTYSLASCGKLSTITFDGTIAEWEAINKGFNWKDETLATYVVCNDGDAPI